MINKLILPATVNSIAFVLTVQILMKKCEKLILYAVMAKT